MKRYLRNEEGIGLIVALGVMFVVSISAAAALAYTGTSSRQSSVEQNRQESYALAEAGLTHALSVLANNADPRTAANYSSSAPITMEGGTYSYTAVRSGPVWTLTGIGTLPNPSGGAPLVKQVYRTVQIQGVANMPIPPEWDRIFAGNPDKCTKLKDVTIEGPFEVAGDLCMEKESKVNSDWVQVGGGVELKGNDAQIGLPGNRVGWFAARDQCKWDKNKNKSELCNDENNVYADETGEPQILDKPDIDWQYWFDNAMPGPRYGCTVGSMPAKGPDLGDDDDMDGSEKSFNMTPKDTSYTCQVTDSFGYVLGELSWNHLTHVLKVKGVIYIDGDVNTTDATITNYQGKATIYISGKWHNHEIFCAGGDGTNDCRDDMSNWNPQENMLWIIAGATAKKDGTTDLKFHKKNSAFQGGLYAQNKCDVKGMTSGPIICDELKLGKDTDDEFAQHSAWPPLNIEVGGFVSQPGDDFAMLLGPQYG